MSEKDERSGIFAKVRKELPVAPVLIAVVRAEDIYALEVGERGDPQLYPVCLVGYSNIVNAYLETAEPDNPHTKTWVARSILYPVWESLGRHGNNGLTGECICTVADCAVIAYVQASGPAHKLAIAQELWVLSHVANRRAWLDHLKGQKTEASIPSPAQDT